jgi:YVTN family beta-propeller protein
MSRGRFAVSSLVLCGLLLAAIASPAGARVAYVSGVNDFASSPFVVPVDLASQAAGAEIPLPGGGEGGGGRIAITPDGTRAYVADPNTDQVVPVDVATNTAGTPIDVGSGPFAVAITPDGTRAYVTNSFDSTVTPIDVATNRAGAAIAVGSFPRGIAITPGGTRAYVANLFSNNVSVIDLATNTVSATIPVGANPSGVAVTPNGTRVYVSDNNDTLPIDVAANTAGTAIGGAPGVAIAITPDGTRAYTADANGGAAVPVDLVAATAGSPIATGGFPTDIAILPDGTRGFQTTPDQVTPLLVPIDVAANTALAGFPVGRNPQGIAIVPNQGPRATFSNSPQSAATGQAVSFDAAGSIDSDGTVARYDWDFGDGTTVANGGDAPSHTYARVGTYTVILTVTDNEGCSTTIVFTGQTASCNGSSAARVSHTVTIAPIVEPSCPRVQGSASSFVPRIRSSHVVPGVRVRLAASQPATLGVEATLLWSKEGQRRETALDRLSVRIDHWRRIRLPLPGEIRDDLPLGSRVRVRLRIEARPHGNSTCGGRVTHRTLKVRVVEVIPSAVQRGRAR